MIHATSTRAERAVLAGAAVLVAVSVAFRCYALGRIPGVNGDEAWYGVQVLRLLAGEQVDWRTPSGNLLGPIHSGLLLLLQPFAPRSLAALRLPALISSLAQLVLTWLVVRRHFGRSAALVALVLTAVLPIDLAYARFGWDASHSGLVAIAALHFALSGVAWASAGLLALALAVQPTNVFLGPFLFSTFLFAEVARRGWRGAAPRTGLHGLLLVAALALIPVVTSGGTGQAYVGGALDRATEPSEPGNFALLFVRFLSGDTVYQYVVGEGFGGLRRAVDFGVGLLLISLLAVGAVRLAKRPAGPEAGIVLGWLATLASFFLLAGSNALRPHVERYGMVLVVPTIVAVTILLGELAASTGRRWVPDALVGGIAALALVGFGTRYLAAIDERGSTSHPTFFTGPVEPKAEAFRLVSSEAAAKGRARVIAEDWWTYWPIAWLGHGTPIEVVPAEEGDRPPLPGGTYWVGFAGGPLERWASGNPALLPRWEVAGAGGHTVLRVWWTPPGAEPIRGRRSAGAPY